MRKKPAEGHCNRCNKPLPKKHKVERDGKACAACRAWNSARHKEDHLYFKALGICTKCRKADARVHPDDPTRLMSTCEPCQVRERARRRARVKKQREAGLCSVHNCARRPREGRRICEHHLARLRQRHRRRKRAWKANLQCTSCGRERETHREGLKTCQHCDDYRRARAARLLAEGRCVICTAPRGEGREAHRLCAACQAKATATSERFKARAQAAGKCRSCSAPLDGRRGTLCEPCRVRKRARDMERRDGLHAQGVCVLCREGMTAADLAAGRRSCGRCRARAPNRDRFWQGMPRPG